MLGLLLAPDPSAAQQDPLAEGAPQPAVATDPEGPVFRVSRFEVDYADPHPEAPSLASLLAAPFELGVLPTGFTAPGPDRPSEVLSLPAEGGGEVLSFHASALGRISAEILARLRARGLLGVYVAPHERDIDLERELDLRRSGDTVLRIVISIGRVRELRSVGFGSRLPETWRINNKVHRRIRELSPVQPEELAEGDTTSLLDADRLEDYLHRLNRHPGRRVDAALAPASEGPGIALDYRVSEPRPWYVYAQTSNTGTEETNRWQTRVGVVHQQLTNRDDILSIDYLNGGLDDVHSVSLSYDAPWLRSRRPDWMRAEEDAPGWLAALPWIGSDRMRWAILGSWTSSKVSRVGGFDDIDATDWEAGARLEGNVFQRRNLFLDVYGGSRVRSIQTENDVFQNNRGAEYLWLPEIGVELEQVDEVSARLASVSFEGSPLSLGNDRDRYGRIDPAERWALLRFDAWFSQFLEPLVNRSGWEDPATPGSSKLAHELVLRARGQWSFDTRVVPQVTQVIGGLYSVRGYDQSLAAGDSVMVGGLEYRFHLARSLPLRERPLRLPLLGDFRAAPQQVYGFADWDLVLSAFLDAGRTWRHDRPDGSFEQNDTLVGAGVGAELQLLGRYRARVDWAQALKSAGARGQGRQNSGDHELYFLFSVVF